MNEAPKSPDERLREIAEQVVADRKSFGASYRPGVEDAVVAKRDVFSRLGPAGYADLLAEIIDSFEIKPELRFPWGTSITLPLRRSA